MTAPVLPKDMKRKQILDEFLHYCEQKQIEAVKKHDPLMLCIWIKEARLARRELAELFRAKEKRDEERERDRENILGIINRLKSQGIDASVVERAHYITLAK
ncbi:hypothetical protein [Bacillus cytotoxicus]|uniref:hypothetical protein n=1 Tax=Bacillus cytotoxicus TaxID=580165 RepID=UPI0015949A37|nr:hypothetical protein [Bacillus cytotoxicus]MDH2858874.1 hypothetical protein [Bacillus cytotoxicus]MDH2871357.1 hypothetical protein [Bacillus cytotoxicus]MDH2874862.1 hypothetical protein [Bacillus cytotoxicus]MDH2919764.1 hypothetical protein [Bacillus cytotoxicus]QTR85078.1 hypothetical protein JC777_12510 [Bacillus cytotoxicus]